jgi:hypothetical protein
VARLIYAFLAFALGTLVAGFIVRDSSIPLFVSIGLSALVLLMILFGTSRRLRRTTELEDEQEELAGLEVVEIEEAPKLDVLEEEADVLDVAPKRRASRRRAAVTPKDEVQLDDTAATSLDDLELYGPDDVETEVVVPKRRARTTRARARKAADVEVGNGEARADDVGADVTEVVVEPEGQSTVATPATEPVRTPARRRTSRTRTAPRAGTAATMGAETTVRAARPPSSPPALSPKVWVIPGRSRYHTQDCRFAKGDTLREVTEATAQRRGYVACSVCNPGSAG